MTPPPPPVAACVTLTRPFPAAGAPPLTAPVDIEFDCERGRVVEDAILGSAAPLRDPLLGFPEARFLVVHSVRNHARLKSKRSVHTVS